jgi:hypothetical protein
MAALCPPWRWYPPTVLPNTIYPYPRKSAVITQKKIQF